MIVVLIVFSSIVFLTILLFSSWGKTFFSYLNHKWNYYFGSPDLELRLMKELDRSELDSVKWELLENPANELRKKCDYNNAIAAYEFIIQKIQEEPNSSVPIDKSVLAEESKEAFEISKKMLQGRPRFYLAISYEKIGKYKESLEQINWLLDNNVAVHMKNGLVSKKNELMSKLNSG